MQTGKADRIYKERSMFLVLRCPECGQIQVQECRKKVIDMVFKCKYCRLSRKVVKKDMYAVNILFRTAHPQEASKVAIQLKNR